MPPKPSSGSNQTLPDAAPQNPRARTSRPQFTLSGIPFHPQPNRRSRPKSARSDMPMIRDPEGLHSFSSVVDVPTGSASSELKSSQPPNHPGVSISDEEGHLADIRSSPSPIRPTSNFLEDNDVSSVAYPDDHSPQRSPYQINRDRQASTWQDRTIPTLVPIWLQVLRESANLLRIPAVTPHECSCMMGRTSRDVVCMSYRDIKVLRVPTCCAPQFLLTRGFFPCTPTAPSLAVDVQDLYFATRLFSRTAPGISSWTASLEDCLALSGIQIGNEGALRIRFGNCLRWFAVLLDQVEDHIRQLGEEIELGAETEGAAPEKPSSLLSRRCPLCFSCFKIPDPRKEIVDVMVQIDACFTQKRTAVSHGRDPIMKHPDSLWLCDSVVSEMEAKVAATRATQPNQVPNPKVAHTIVDECEDHHKASKEGRVKANATFFADTGIMALLCHHDRPLFLVNLTSAGEKQHYALALIQELLKNIPSSWRITLLYDIACVLERSCLKWDFLGTDLKRFTFAVSVFHAYGHQYACQLLYHPRKQIGCGLFDGEGCERTWSKFSPFISTLRVSGYYQRLYTLDRRVHFISAESFTRFGEWLQRKWKLCQEVKQDSKEALDELMAQGITLEKLEEEWQLEVQTESNPPSWRVTSASIDKVLDQVVGLWDTRQDLQKEIRDLERWIVSGNEQRSSQELVVEVKEAREQLRKVNDTLDRVKSDIGVAKWSSIMRMVDAQWTRLRLLALGYKQRLRYTLRMRKRELERMERAHVMASNAANASDRNLDARISQYVHSKDSSVAALWKKFDAVLDEMVEEMKEGRAPAGAKMPRRIPRDRLWKLDVDDDIWNDAGLEFMQIGEEDVGLPDWLGNETVRGGISVLLKYRRACEEEEQLKKERRLLQQTALQEWDRLSRLMKNASQDLAFVVASKRDTLLRVIVEWERQVHWMPCDIEMTKSWGPSIEEMANVLEMRGQIVVPGRGSPEVGPFMDGEDEIAQVWESFEDGDMVNYVLDSVQID